MRTAQRGRGALPASPPILLKCVICVICGIVIIVVIRVIAVISAAVEARPDGGKAADSRGCGGVVGGMNPF
jgi:hypothetical protein